MSINKLCEFNKTCQLFREYHFTCTHYGGGPYCGKYRELCLQVKIEELNQEINALSIQYSKFQDPKICKRIEKKILNLQELKLLFQKEESIKKLVNEPKIEVS